MRTVPFLATVVWMGACTTWAGVLDPAHVAEAAALAAVLHRCRLLSSSSPRRYLSFSRVDLRISNARRRLIALVGRNGSELLSTLLVLHGK